MSSSPESDEHDQRLLELLDDLDEAQREYLDEQFSVPIEDAIVADGITVSIAREAVRSDNLYSWSEPTAVGVEQDWELTVILKWDHNVLTETASVPLGTTITSFSDTGETERDYIILGIEEDESEYECTYCERTFDSNEWVYAGGYGDRSGATTIYDCPTDECAGEAHVVI